MAITETNQNSKSHLAHLTGMSPSSLLAWVCVEFVATMLNQLLTMPRQMTAFMTACRLLETHLSSGEVDQVPGVLGNRGRAQWDCPVQRVADHRGG